MLGGVEKDLDLGGRPGVHHVTLWADVPSLHRQPLLRQWGAIGLPGECSGYRCFTWKLTL